MDNKSVFILIILIILGCCIVGLILVYLNPGFIFKDNAPKAPKTGLVIQLSDENDNFYKDSCRNDDYPCFMYIEFKQTRLESFKYPEVEQTRLEPCPKPKPICPICREEIKQVRGDGYFDKVIQTRFEC
jgi:hypothetical protein